MGGGGGLGGFYVKRGREGRKETPVGVIASRHLATILRALHKLDIVSTDSPNEEMIPKDEQHPH